MDIKSASYADLIFLRERLDKEQSQLLDRINEVQEQLNAVNVVIALLRGEAMPLSHRFKMRESQDQIQKTTPTQALLPSTIPPFSDSLKGKTQLEALKMIAQSHAGQLRATEARRLLIKAGLIRTPKNAASIIFNVIKKSGLFERMSPGVYRLIDTPAPAPQTQRLAGIDAALKQIEEKFGHKSA